MSSCQAAPLQQRQTRRTLCARCGAECLYSETQILQVLRAPSRGDTTSIELQSSVEIVTRSTDGNKRANDVMIVCADTARFVFSLPGSELVSFSVPARARLDLSVVRAHPPPSPSGLHVSHWAFAPSSSLAPLLLLDVSVLSGERHVDHFVMGALIEDDEDVAAKVVVRLSVTDVLVHFACTRYIPNSLPAHVPQVKCSNRTEFLVRCSSRAEQSDSLDAYFSVVPKSAAFPYPPVTAAFLGFASGWLAGAFRAGTIFCPANGVYLSVSTQKRSAIEPAH